MENKFRIKEHNGNYYPQVKKFGLWMYLYFDNKPHLTWLYFRRYISKEESFAALAKYYEYTTTQYTYYNEKDLSIAAMSKNSIDC